MIRVFLILLPTILSCASNHHRESSAGSAPESVPDVSGSTPESVPDVSGSTPESVPDTSRATLIDAGVVEVIETPPRIRHVEGLAGFVCTQYRKTPDAPKAIGQCYRTQKTCEQEVLRMRKEGHGATDCAPGKTAYCFNVHEPDLMRSNERCFDQVEHCRAQRAEYQTKYPDLVFLECRLTAQRTRVIRPEYASLLQAHAFPEETMKRLTAKE